ncbi:hypothetical protein [Nocardioides daejeonensis]|uniref:hypothetical protein n=1 Tax=Nocardioides daejeonensis TaxID=1046556 RepID=UPI000D74F83F|nr:hypothetical protein [Nocardioides daejeonensis]
MNDQQHTQPIGAGQAPDSEPNESTYVLPDPQAADTLPSGDSGPDDDSWRHPVNTGHLVMGVAFAGILLVWALLVGDVVEWSDVRWLLPLPWVVAGAVGLAAATHTSLRSRRRSPA